MTRRPAGRVLALVGIAVLAAGLMAGGCGVWSSPADPAVVVVGVDMDLTGNAAGLDGRTAGLNAPAAGRAGAFDHALQLTAERINERGLAGAGRRVELRVLDNRGDPALSAQNLATLASDPEVTAVITAGCASCVIDAAGSLSVPVIALTGEETVAAPAAERRWVFRLGPNAADDADVLSAAMAADGLATVAVVAASDGYGRDGVRWFAAAAQRDGLAVTTTVEAPAAATEAELTALATSLLDRRRRSATVDDDGPDAVLLWTYASQATVIAQALRAAGYGGRFYADMVAVDELFGPGPLVGARLVATPTAVAAERIAASPAAAMRQEWVLSYVSRYGGYRLHATWAADALLVLADAVSRAGTPSRAEVRARIESTRIDGITGPIRFTAEQHSGLLPGAVVVLTADGDRWQ